MKKIGDIFIFEAISTIKMEFFLDFLLMMLFIAENVVCPLFSYFSGIKSDFSKIKSWLKFGS